MSSTQTNWQEWITYFEQNETDLMPIDWQTPCSLPDSEIEQVMKSIQQFQLGESSEGHHILMQARHYLTKSGDRDYLPALQLFIAEEQRHARYLARFLDCYGISLSQKHPVDSIFRRIRHTWNLELSIMAMLTAEIIALSYYKALHDATHSLLLRQICRQVLRDEVQHLQFQVDTLRTLQCQHSFLKKGLQHVIQRTLLTGTILIVWQQHHSVFDASHYTFTKFWEACWFQLNHVFTVSKVQ